jgi:hypothetical protein
MAKFGAACAVRTGIHVGGEAMIDLLPPDTRNFCVLSGWSSTPSSRHRRHARRFRRRFPLGYCAGPVTWRR